MENKYLKITTWNVASLRSAWNHDLPHYIELSQPDIFCIQETKLHEESKPNLDFFKLPNYYGYFFHAKKPGYSGTAIYTKYKPLSIKKSFNDPDGRSITIEFNNFYLINTYVVNAGEDLKRLKYKIETFLPQIELHIKELIKNNNKNIIWTGDLNVAHQPIDIWRSEGHETIAGYTPEERNWFNNFLNLGFIDVYRYLHPNLIEYSFFNFRNQSKLKNQGWRIDYFIMNQKSIDNLGVKDCYIEKGIDGSDHQPVTLLLDFNKSLNDIKIDKIGVENLNNSKKNLLNYFK